MTSPMPNLNPRVPLVEPSLFLQHLIKKNLDSLEMSLQDIYVTGTEILQDHGRSFDMLLIDYNLPDMTGLALAEKILHDTIYARLVLIIPESLSHESQDFIAHGLQATLVKPFSEEALQKVLIEAIANAW